MNDKINKSVEPFQEFLNNNFKQCSKESIKVEATLLSQIYSEICSIVCWSCINKMGLT